MASADWYCDVLSMEAFEACETFIVYLLSVFGFDIYKPTGVNER